MAYDSLEEHPIRRYQSLAGALPIPTPLQEDQADAKLFESLGGRFVPVRITSEETGIEEGKVHLLGFRPNGLRNWKAQPVEAWFLCDSLASVEDWDPIAALGQAVSCSNCLRRMHYLAANVVAARLIPDHLVSLSDESIDASAREFLYGRISLLGNRLEVVNTWGLDGLAPVAAPQLLLGSNGGN